MHFSLFAITLGLATSTFAQRTNRQGERPGQNPDAPLYVNTDTNSVANPSLLPADTYLTIEQTDVFQNLVGSIIDSQQELSILAPDSEELFEESIEQWENFEDALPNYRLLRVTDYTRPLQALRVALISLDTPVGSRNNKRQVNRRQGQLQDILTRLLLDNLFLAGFFNNVYDDEAVPTTLVDQPGEVVGILTRYLAIDVNKALDFWPGKRR